MIRSFLRDTFGVDETNPIPSRTVRPEIDAADCIAVGSTLRALARTNPQCGDALERVGAALVKAAVPRQRVRGERGCI